MNTAFDSWLATEIGNGLADIKFAVVAGKGVSVNAIQNEVLAAEAAVGVGYLKPAPRATSMIPQHVAEFVSQC